MQTIYLEFRRPSGNLAANGSDIVTFLDGRWGTRRRTEHVHAKLAELRELRGSRYKDQHFAGFSIAGRSGELHVKMSDPNPPSWVA